VEREKDLDSFFTLLASALQGAYVLAYEPLPDGAKVKKLEVESTRPKIKLLYAKD